jgi:hypothetical protein
MRIVVRIPDRPRRWHLQLCERLRQGGHEAGLIVDASGPRLDGFSTLAAIEAKLYRPLPGGGESAFVEMADAAAVGLADLEIDLTGRREAVPGAAPQRLVPFFDAVAGETALVGSLLDGRAPEIVIGHCVAGEIRPVVTGMPALEEPHRVIRSFDRVCARLADLLVAAVRQLVRGAEGTTLMPWQNASSLGRVDFATAGLCQFVGRLHARLQQMTSGGHEWRVAWRIADPGSLVAGQRTWPAASYQVLPDDGKRYYADPFLFAHEGRTWLFCEEFSFAMDRGILSVVEMGPQGPCGNPRPFLEQDCHLSYPQVFAHEGAVYMIPETGERRTVELWRAEALPDRWVQVATLIEGVALADATLVRHDNRWWLFAALQTDGQSSWDTLCLYSAHRLEGPWREHPGNPVVIDSRSARPAGRMWVEKGALWRPVQDCSAGYGSRLGLARVTRLDLEGFAQEMAVSLAPPVSWRARGAHSLDAAGGFEVIDVLAPAAIQLPAALL